MLTLILVVAVCCLSASGFPTGAPTDSCVTMLPQHDNSVPQNSPSPYSIQVARNGNDFIVTLVDDSGLAPFRGFLMQARHLDTSTLVGQFTVLPSDGAQLLSCLLPGNSVTNTNSNPRQSIQVTWNSRGADLSGVYIVATVVQQFETFWADIRSTDLATVANDPCLAFELVTRAEWNARPPTSIQYLVPPVNMTFVHHTAGDWQCFDKETCIEMVQSIQDLHMDVNGWADIGYSFLIGEDGRAYEGRGWNVVGAHTLNYNTIALGFCVIGDFMLRLPNDLALNTLQNILACGVQRNYITEDYEMFGHRDGRCTLCPGDKLYAEIRTWPRYSFRQIPIYCR